MILLEKLKPCLPPNGPPRFVHLKKNCCAFGLPFSVPVWTNCDICPFLLSKYISLSHWVSGFDSLRTKFYFCATVQQCVTILSLCSYNVKMCDIVCTKLSCVPTMCIKSNHVVVLYGLGKRKVKPIISVPIQNSCVPHMFN